MSKENPTEMERLIVKKFLRGEMKLKDCAPALGITDVAFAFLVSFTSRKFVEEYRMSMFKKISDKVDEVYNNSSLVKGQVFIDEATDMTQDQIDSLNKDIKVHESAVWDPFNEIARYDDDELLSRCVKAWAQVELYRFQNKPAHAEEVHREDYMPLRTELLKRLGSAR